MLQLKGMILNGILLLSLASIVVTYLLIKARERKRVHDVLSKALDNGVTPPPDLLKAIIEYGRPRAPTRTRTQRDLRNGIVWLSVAMGLGVLAMSLVTGHDPQQLKLPIKEPLAALGIAALPAAIGVGYLLLWWLGKDKTP
jgi:hypothetical protein